MEKSEKILALLLFVVTFLFLQSFNAYHFYYMEQFQLFLTTPSYFFESISHPGGAMEYLSHFLVQFFIFPYLGALIEAFTLTLVFILTSTLFARLGNNRILFLAPASVFLSCLIACFDSNFYFQGILSFLFCLGFLLVFTSGRTSAVVNSLAFVSVPLLYWLAGPVSMLFAVSFFLIRLVNGKDKTRFYWLLLPVFASLISWLAVRYALIGEFRISFFPDFYYQHIFRPKLVIYLSWIFLLAWIPVVPFVGATYVIKKRKVYISAATQAVILLFLLWGGIVKYREWNFYGIKKLDYYERNEQWNKIILELKGKNVHNYLYQNYLNLALAQEGNLCSDVFHYSQNGSSSLMVSPEDKRATAPLLSDICFCIGDIASSMQYAFEGNESCPRGYSGRLLKRLVQTNLIYGEYAVAEKYIHILEHTLFYREWATSQRRFLYNDPLCRKDSLIAAKRECLPVQGSRDFGTAFPEILRILIAVNPSNKQAEDYLLVFCLLSKDLKSFSDFLFRSGHDETNIVSLPASFQQALLIYYESQPGKWKEKGISDETIRQYRDYKSLFIRNSRDPGLKLLMQKQFASTYWFYYQFI